MTGTATFKIWIEMRRRCRATNRRESSRYSERGIGVCPDWDADFMAFLRDMGERPDGMTLDRIDGTEGYSPSNCRWASYTQQNRNKPSIRRYQVRSEMLAIPEIVERYGVSRDRIRRGIGRGMSVDAILAKNNVA